MFMILLYFKYFNILTYIYTYIHINTYMYINVHSVHPVDTKKGIGGNKRNG